MTANAERRSLRPGPTAHDLIEPIVQGARQIDPGSNQSVSSIDAASATSDLLALRPGRTVGLVGSPGLGLTRLGLTMLAEPSRRGPIAYVDVRGWLSPLAAWEAGIDTDRLVMVRCADPVTWARVVTALLGGLEAVFAEVPARTKDTHLRRLAAMARTRRSSLLLRPVQGGLPGGVAHLCLEARNVQWEGTEQGFGHLRRRRLVLVASGKAVLGMERIIEVEDDGTDAVHLVPGLGAAPVGLPAG